MRPRARRQDGGGWNAANGCFRFDRTTGDYTLQSNGMDGRAWMVVTAENHVQMAPAHGIADLDPSVGSTLAEKA